MNTPRQNSSRIASSCLAAIALVQSSAQAQTNEIISVNAAGAPANNRSEWGSISADGRYVAFSSMAEDILPNSTIAIRQVYVRDRTTATTVRLSVSAGGALGNQDSVPPVISGDGMFVAFASRASNLIPGDTNAQSDVFISERTTGTLAMLSITASGAPGNGVSSVSSHSVSFDGSLIGFHSTASDLVNGDTNGFRDVFVRNRIAGSTERVSVSSSGGEGNGSSEVCSMSPDGRFVAFQSSASNLVAGDLNGLGDIFVRDRVLGTTTLVSVSTLGVQGNAPSTEPSISADGRFVVFESSSSTLDPGQPFVQDNVFVRDRLQGTTRQISVSSWGGAGNANSRNGRVSADGRFAVFDTNAQLVLQQTHHYSEVMLCDLETYTVERVSMAWNDADANRNAYHPSLSADGRFVVYDGDANLIVPFDTDSKYDVFVRDRGDSPFTANCSGDGSANDCPCSNLGGLRRGCGNSYSAGGARLAATGRAKVSLDSVVLVATGLPNTLAIFFQGTSPFGSGSGVAFGDGLRCARGQTVRIVNRTVTNHACFVGDSFTIDENVSAFAHVPPAGGLFHYQAWYRDEDPGFCTSGLFNLTNGLDIAWVP